MAASAAFIDGYVRAMGVFGPRGQIVAPLTEAAYAHAKRDCNAVVREFGSAWKGKLSDVEAGFAFGRTRNGEVGSFRWVLNVHGGYDFDAQIRATFPALRLQGNKTAGYSFVRRNPAPKHGSVEHFLMSRGVREFTQADLESNIGGSPNMLAMELGRLVAQGKVIKSSRSGGVQFYQVVEAPAPKYESQAEYREEFQRSAEQQQDVDLRVRTLATLGSIPEVQAMRAQQTLQRAQQSVSSAAAGKRTVEQQIAAAQAKRDRAALVRLESQLESATAVLARAKRALMEAERDVRKLDPESLAPKRNPRRKRRKK